MEISTIFDKLFYIKNKAEYNVFIRLSIRSYNVYNVTFKNQLFLLIFESERLDTYDIVFVSLNTIYKCQMKSNV